MHTAAGLFLQRQKIYTYVNIKEYIILLLLVLLLWVLLLVEYWLTKLKYKWDDCIVDKFFQIIASDHVVYGLKCENGIHEK